MDVRWCERDWEPLREEVAEARPAVRATLAASGMLNFFECPLLRAQEYLLQFLIEMWSPQQHYFLVRGEHVAFTADNAYDAEGDRSGGVCGAILLRRALHDWVGRAH